MQEIDYKQFSEGIMILKKRISKDDIVFSDEDLRPFAKNPVSANFFYHEAKIDDNHFEKIKESIRKLQVISNVKAVLIKFFVNPDFEFEKMPKYFNIFYDNTGDDVYCLWSLSYKNIVGLSPNSVLIRLFIRCE